MVLDDTRRSTRRYTRCSIQIFTRMVLVVVLDGIGCYQMLLDDTSISRYSQYYVAMKISRESWQQHQECHLFGGAAPRVSNFSNHIEPSCYGLKHHM